MANPTNKIQFGIALAYRLGYAAGDPLQQFFATGGGAGTAVYNAWAPVTLSSGLLIESTSAISGANTMLGFVQTAATASTPAFATTPTGQLVMIPLPGIVFEGTLSDSTGSHTSAQADIGSLVAISKDAAAGRNNWYLDAHVNPAAGAAALVLGFRQDVVIGTTVDARCYFTVGSDALLNLGF